MRGALGPLPNHANVAPCRGREKSASTRDALRRPPPRCADVGADRSLPRLASPELEPLEVAGIAPVVRAPAADDSGHRRWARSSSATRSPRYPANSQPNYGSRPHSEPTDHPPRCMTANAQRQPTCEADDDPVLVQAWGSRVPSIAARATSARSRLRARAYSRRRANASSSPMPARSEITPLACSITIRLFSAVVSCSLRRWVSAVARCCTTLIVARSANAASDEHVGFVDRRRAHVYEIECTNGRVPEP